LPSWCPALASGCRRRGDVVDGLAAIEEGLTLARKGGDSFSLSEIHRVKATLLLARSAADRSAAEVAYGEAIEVARGQQARPLELRAARGLARLWGQNGRRGAAHKLLAPIYGVFTEGFDTPDLKEAKALLDELRE